jgi:GAF domain-containing protein
VRERPNRPVLKTGGRKPRGFESHPLRSTYTGARITRERCESGRIGLTANEVTWETGSEGSNPSLSAMTEEPMSLDEGLRELSRLVLQEETLETTLQRIVDVANGAIPDTVGVSITLKRGHQPYTAVTTSPQVQAIDEREYAVDEGPCISAMETGELQILDDVASETRWPKFVQVCREEGLGSTLGVPLRVGDTAYGAMNIYALTAHAFTGAHREAAQLLGEQAGIALANSRTYGDAVERIRQLQEALDSRIVIEQAKGVLMATEGIDADAAFDVLRTRSQRENRKLRAVAEEVVASVLTRT